MKTLLLSTQILLLALGARGENVFLHNASDLVSFSSSVNSGKDYTGTTVILDADIDFSGYSDKFVPIGTYSNDNSLAFKGVFDGQGHKISNLEMSSSSTENLGFFGYSYGASIKNIIFDSSCSFASTVSGEGVATLGPISYFAEGNEIENIVNMAKITFTITAKINYIVVGGIAGKVNHNSAVKNCVNYGNISVTGTSNYIFVGGIVGNLIGTTNVRCSIQSCINYGSISNAKRGSDFSFLGGIAGYTQLLFSIESCVNSGEISPSYTLNDKNKIGGIVGAAFQPGNNAIIDNCYWIDNIEGYNKQYQDGGTPRQTDSKQVEEMDEKVLNKLNGGSTSGSDGKWLLNSGGHTVTFYVNNKEYFQSTSQMILTPSFEEERIAGNFSGWFTNASCTTLFTSSKVTESTDLYGIHKTLVTVSFDVNEGEIESSSSSIVATYTAPYGELPSATRTEHAFLGWFTGITDGDKVEETTNVTNPDSHTLYAHWAINNYTVFFNLTNGTVIESVFGYNEAIKYPSNESIERDGFVFDGWNSSIEFMPGANITIEATWTEIIPSSSSSIISSSSSSSSSIVSSSSSVVSSSSSSKTISSNSRFISEYVEIVFGKKDMSREEVEEFIRKYTDSNAFTIEELKSDNGTVVIVKFEDTERATSFIESIKASSDSTIMVTVKPFIIQSFASSFAPLFAYLATIF